MLLCLPSLWGGTPRVIDLASGWKYFQDVHGEGERLGVYRRDSHHFNLAAISSWEPLPRLTHLQLLLAPQPYFGRELRYFNQDAWWYRLEFPTPPGAGNVTLRFEGVDYYAKVWLNDQLLGEHEGYSDPFEFEVGKLLETGRPNVLSVKVSSPWDTQKQKPGTNWVHLVVRTMIKGTYEHADTFVQRDVNPVGIWKPVKLVVHDGLRAGGLPVIRTSIGAGGRTAGVSVALPVVLDEGAPEAQFQVRLFDDRDNLLVARSSSGVRLVKGANRLEASLEVAQPRLWSTWDRGGPALYRARLEVLRDGQTSLARDVTFGIRTVELRRTPEEMTFVLNGKPLYLRGATYWPDIYISKSDRSRYERDVAAAVRAGMNALRVHVHSENEEFYEVCDRMGIVLLQDSDLNWAFPTDEQFVPRALEHFTRLIGRLGNHPSIIGWIAINEAREGMRGPQASVRPGPQLLAAGRAADPTRPIIRNSGDTDDAESGDTHDYTGALGDGNYTQIFGRSDRLVTEFGMDAPASAVRLRQVPQLADKLASVLPRAAEIHDYQYRLIKYFIEHYRAQKYAPNSGYFQFMWIDFCPQSFYGIYDYWGVPKMEGIGGGLKALEESNQPVAILMEYKDAPGTLWAVNDTLADLGDCRASWRVTDEGGAEVAKGSAAVRLGADSRARVADLRFETRPEAVYQICLELRGPDGRELARNTYRDPFHHPSHPEGHPLQMDHELGMRLWWAPGGAVFKDW